MKCSILYVKIKPVNVILTKFCLSEICPKKYAFTKLLKFNFIRKSVDATVYVRKMEARASRDLQPKTINELLSFMPKTVTYQLSKEDRICIVQNFAVHGGVEKSSTPFRRTGREM